MCRPARPWSARRRSCARPVRRPRAPRPAARPRAAPGPDPARGRRPAPRSGLLGPGHLPQRAGQVAGHVPDQAEVVRGDHHRGVQAASGRLLEVGGQLGRALRHAAPGGAGPGCAGGGQLEAGLAQVQHAPPGSPQSGARMARLDLGVGHGDQDPGAESGRDLLRRRTGRRPRSASASSCSRRCRRPAAHPTSQGTRPGDLDAVAAAPRRHRRSSSNKGVVESAGIRDHRRGPLRRGLPPAARGGVRPAPRCRAQRRTVPRPGQRAPDLGVGHASRSGSRAERGRYDITIVNNGVDQPALLSIGARAARPAPGYRASMKSPDPRSTLPRAWAHNSPAERRRTGAKRRRRRPDVGRSLPRHDGGQGIDRSLFAGQRAEQIRHLGARSRRWPADR